MSDAITSTLVFDLCVHTEDTGSHWLAIETRLGILVFADTQLAAIDRLKNTITLVLNDLSQYGQGEVRSYLQSHNVHPTIVERAPWAFGVIKASEEPNFANVQ